MALESRAGRVYHYVSERRGRRVVRRYAGCGTLAVAGQQLDDAERAVRRLNALERSAREARMRDRLKALRRWFGRLDGVVATALGTAGWHRQNRSEWRKKRGAAMGALVAGGELPWHGWDLSRAAGKLDPAVAEKASKGDWSVAGAVEGFLASPAAAALWGDVGRRVLQRWAHKYARGCVTTEVAVLRHAADLRDRLTGPSPDALVQLVAERVVVAWVTANYFESVYASQPDALPAAQHKYHVARIEAANRALMSACRTLAKVRRAKLPDVVALVSVVPPTT